MKSIFIIIAAVFSLIGCNQQVSTTQKSEIGTQKDNVPSWISDYINEKQNKNTENPPASIKKCVYKDQTVYLVSSPCCDQYNYLYDDKKNSICAPSGGFTGKGDGKCKDFSFDSCENLWTDTRTSK